MSADEHPTEHTPTDLIAAVLRPLERPGDVDLLPLEWLATRPPTAPWRVMRGVRCEPSHPLRGGSVVRARGGADGVLRIEPRYDDVVELLTPDRAPEALLNALWALTAHGLRGDGPHVRAYRVLARLERNPDERVRAEAREAAKGL